MEKKIKLAYCMVGAYIAGGLEHIVIVKLNYLAQQGYEVYLITSSQGGRPFFYELDPRIKHIDLDIRYDLAEAHGRLDQYLERRKKHRLHRERLEQVLMELRPDITVAPGLDEQKFVYKIKDGSIKVSEHHTTKLWNVYRYSYLLQAIENPSLRTRLSLGLRALWGRLMTMTYSWYDKHYDLLVLLTEEDRQGFKWHPHTEVIPNPKPLEFSAPSPLSEKSFIAVGRLYPSKNFSELISIWSEVASEYPDWKLRIVGGGYMQGVLTSQIKELGLESQVELVGEVSDVSPYYLSSSLFVSTSFYEGLPLCMIEAATAGLPLLAYACPCGPRDIIQEGKNGFLVEQGDRKTFVARLRELLAKEELRQTMGKAARESSERYAPERIMQTWDKLFSSLVQQKK